MVNPAAGPRWRHGTGSWPPARAPENRAHRRAHQRRRQAATAGGRARRAQNVSEFLLDAGVTAAAQALADRRHFSLDEAQWQAFQEALDRPVQTKPRLKKLLREPGVLG
ncbi:MAG: DUF1778 domain-containing protein [Ottowia sp.]